MRDCIGILFFRKPKQEKKTKQATKWDHAGTQKEAVVLDFSSKKGDTAQNGGLEDKYNDVRFIYTSRQGVCLKNHEFAVAIRIRLFQNVLQ